MQDDYDRSRKMGRLPVVSIENDFLKLTLYQELGGRLISIYDKQKARELLFDNLVFQPANLAVLNAWFSGGIEWNGLIPGHSPFTCSPVFTAVVETEHGPLLRLYEFERIREAPWQIDLYLPPDEDKLWIHVRIINPNPYEINCYWWINIAAPLEKETRVLSPADYCIEHVLPDNHLERFDFPYAHGFDGSYPANYPYAASVFFRKPKARRPWIATVQKNCQGLFHTSTKELVGSKLFVFGNKRGGQHWMDFLSLPGKGNYIELQAGAMPTQDQVFILRGGERIEWTECIAPLELEPETAFEQDYKKACHRVESILLEKIPDKMLKQKDHWLHEQADRPIAEILQHGSAWGMLFEKTTGKKMSPGLNFETPITVERMWNELIDSGTFSEQTLKQMPESWAVSDRWISVLERSATHYGTSWLHELLLGVAKLNRRQHEEAHRHLETSRCLNDNFMVNRHLAIIHLHKGDQAAAKDLYLAAWSQSNSLVPLAVEICQFFQKEKMYHSLESFLSQLPDQILQHERIQLARGEASLSKGEFDPLREILKGEFSTIREGEVSLTHLWFLLHLKEAEARKGAFLSEQEQAEVIKQNPPPYNIDFRMTDT